MTNPLRRPWPVRIEPPTKVEITEGVTYKYFYRFRLKGTQDWLTDWESYIPGSEELFIENDTGVNQTYEFQQKTDVYASLIFVRSDFYFSEVVVEPTSQFSFVNWNITPNTSAPSGTWDWSVDISSNPPYVGPDIFNVTVSASFEDSSGNVVDTSAYAPQYDTTISGSFFRPIWEQSVPTSAIQEFGLFDFTANISPNIPTSIQPASDQYIRNDLWEGTFIHDPDPGPGPLVCIPFEKIGIYDWSSSFASIVQGGSPTLPDGDTWFYLNYDSDQYNGPGGEATVTLLDGAGNVITQFEPDASVNNVTFSYFQPGAINVNGWFWVLTDTFGDGGVAINWAKASTGIAPTECFP